MCVYKYCIHLIFLHYFQEIIYNNDVTTHLQIREKTSVYWYIYIVKIRMWVKVRTPLKLYVLKRSESWFSNKSFPTFWEDNWYVISSLLRLRACVLYYVNKLLFVSVNALHNHEQYRKGPLIYVSVICTTVIDTIMITLYFYFIFKEPDLVLNVVSSTTGSWFTTEHQKIRQI